jgi:hypothetical protein
MWTFTALHCQKPSFSAIFRLNHQSNYGFLQFHQRNFISKFASLTKTGFLQRSGEVRSHLSRPKIGKTSRSEPNRDSREQWYIRIGVKNGIICGIWIVRHGKVPYQLLILR